MKTIKRTRLCYVEGTSDKVYNVELVKLDSGNFSLSATYGRRGNVNNMSRPWKSEGSLGEASKRFDDVVRKKVKKGYFIDSTQNLTSSGDDRDNRLEREEKNEKPVAVSPNRINVSQGLTQLSQSSDFF